MPELPEVQTTVNGLTKTVIGLRIVNVWSSYNSLYFKGADNIKDPKFFKYFKGKVVGATIISTGRRAKNILINLNNGKTILVYMKMTGHLLYGKYYFRPKDKGDSWIPISPESLKDPFNRHIRLVFSFSNNKQLALCDSRKFAKVTLINSEALEKSGHLNDIGPEPLSKDFSFKEFCKCISLNPNSKIKQVLMDQNVLAGIGNIYADESLWRAGIHPLQKVAGINSRKKRALFDSICQTLTKGISFGGDSMSDYRNINGEKGRFQETHRAYRKTGQKCSKPRCGGIIQRIMVGSRSAHFCNKHQKLLTE